MKELTLQNIEKEALQASFDAPVLVLFWAAMSPDSVALKALLEKIESELALTAAAANLEEMPQVAQYFGVQALPTLKLIHQGQLVDEAAGALNEAQLRAFLKNYLAAPPCDFHAEIQKFLAENDLESAQKMAETALLNDSKNEIILLDLAEIFLAKKDFASAEGILNQTFTTESARAETLLKRLKLLKSAPNLDSLKSKIAENPDDLQLRLDFARALAANNDFESAFDAALFVLEKDKNFADSAAQKLLLEFFGALEGEAYDSLVRQKRRQMSRILN